MSGFEVGIIFMGSIWVCNIVAENIMKKINKHNIDELNRLKIPIYPIISWIKFKIKIKKEAEQKKEYKVNEVNDEINNDYSNEK